MWQIGAVLILLHSPDLNEASAKGTHTLGKMLARTANSKPCCIFRPVAFYGLVK